MERHDFAPELELEHADQGLLAQTCATEGYRIMHRIFRAELDKLVIALINANPANEREVTSKHLLAKAAAVYYDAVASRIATEVAKYVGASQPTFTPVDLTEDLLDVGALASTQADIEEDLIHDDEID